MSDTWWPWEPRGQRPAGPPGERHGPDPEPIVRSVRVGFVFGGLLVAGMVNAGLHRAGTAAVAPRQLAVTGVVGLLVLVLLAVAWRALRPTALVRAGKRALRASDPRERRPRAERARAMGFRGLAIGWAMQAILIGFVPAFAGLVLDALHDQAWELLAFAGASLLAGVVFERQVSAAVRLAVDDPELRASYGPR